MTEAGFGDLTMERWTGRRVVPVVFVLTGILASLNLLDIGRTPNNAGLRGEK